VVKRIDERAGAFRRNLDRALDRSPLDGSQREDNINQFAREFETATGRLRSQVGDGRRSAEAVDEVLARASAIEQFMRRQRLDERAERDWALISADLSELARMYSVRWGRSRASGHPGDVEIAQLLVRLDRQTAQFRYGLGGTLERFRLAGTRQEDQVERDLQRLAESILRLRERFDARRAGAGDVRQVVSRAQTVDRFVRRWRLDGRSERTWNSVRNDLERLSEIYGVTLRWRVS
jgi:hypothetical protein